MPAGSFAATPSSSRASSSGAWAVGGHAVGGFEVVPVRRREAEVAVERVDEDLEGLRQRELVLALLLAGGGLGRALGGDAHVAQMGEKVEEDAQLVARGRHAAP